MKFSSVCWDITPNCNDKCLFCYRETGSKESTLEKNKVILKNLIVNGVGKISFVGGEPLLYDNLFELVEYGRKLDSTVQFSLTTNAILLAFFDNNSCKLNVDLIERIIKTFDWISFSLDATTERVQSLMGRNEHHITRILSLLEYIQKHNYKIKIKINTVVSKINIDSLLDLNQLLEKYEIDRWKLFKFLPSRGYAFNNRNLFEIEDESFEKCINRLVSISKLHISYCNTTDFVKTYITITSTGFLSVFDGKKYSCVIDMSTNNFNEVFNYIDLEFHKRRRSDYLNVK